MEHNTPQIEHLFEIITKMRYPKQLEQRTTTSGRQAVATKRNNAANGDVIVERVLTSDAFLAREIKRAPLKTKNGSLTADLKHLPERPQDHHPGRARAQPQERRPCDSAQSHGRCSPDCRVRANPRSPSTPCSPKASARYVESLSAYARQFLGQMDKARRRLHRGPEPGRLHRPEDHQPQPAFDRRHHHRNLRLPATALRPHRHPALP